LDFDRHILLPTPIQKLESPFLTKLEVELWVKRDDLTHEAISGNKARKLKYNFLKAKVLNKKTLITFGGAYSNHIYALAAAAKLFGFESIGIIRGDELNEQSSPTLRYASEAGMKLHFVNRTAYRDKVALTQSYESDQSFVIPEGGSNELALIGCSEMMDEVLVKIKPTHFCLSAGTGGTTAGVLSNDNYTGATYCFPVLKNGGFIKDEIEALLQKPINKPFNLFTDYHFGGYAKTKPELLDFMAEFEETYDIQLEQVYTAKLFFGVFDLLKKNHFPKGSKIVLYHSGGLQGRIVI
jgi:1-aminocyclopropane-1-carboxylate deaminase